MFNQGGLFRQFPAAAAAGGRVDQRIINVLGQVSDSDILVNTTPVTTISDVNTGAPYHEGYWIDENRYLCLYRNSSNSLVARVITASGSAKPVVASSGTVKAGHTAGGYKIHRNPNDRNQCIVTGQSTEMWLVTVSGTTVSVNAITIQGGSAGPGINGGQVVVWATDGSHFAVCFYNSSAAKITLSLYTISGSTVTYVTYDESTTGSPSANDSPENASQAWLIEEGKAGYAFVPRYSSSTPNLVVLLFSFTSSTISIDQEGSVSQSDISLPDSPEEETAAVVPFGRYVTCHWSGFISTSNEGYQRAATFYLGDSGVTNIPDGSYQLYGLQRLGGLGARQGSAEVIKAYAAANTRNGQEYGSQQFDADPFYTGRNFMPMQSPNDGSQLGAYIDNGLVLPTVNELAPSGYNSSSYRPFLFGINAEFSRMLLGVRSGGTISLWGYDIAGYNS